MKRKSKSILLLLLIMILSLGMMLTSCGNENAAEGNSDTEVAATETQENANQEENDGGYIDVDDVGDSNADYDKYSNAESSTSYNAESGQDQYHTDPIPEGKPKPVEPDDTTVDKSKPHTCTLYIECSTILSNMEDLTANKESLVPSNGVIYKKQTVTFYEGESVFDVLLRECQNNKIHMEYSWTPMYNSHYIEGINNLYEFDCGELSGWMYSVNGWYPNYGCSRYQVQDGDVIEWHYTCDLGEDLGQYWIE